jgi:hypothetical protein
MTRSRPSARSFLQVRVRSVMPARRKCSPERIWYTPPFMLNHTVTALAVAAICWLGFGSADRPSSDSSSEPSSSSRHVSQTATNSQGLILAAEEGERLTRRQNGYPLTIKVDRQKGGSKQQEPWSSSRKTSG